MWRVEKFSVERKEMSEKIPVGFVTDWKKLDIDFEQAKEEKNVVQKVFLKIKEKDSKRKQVHSSIHNL